MSYTITLTDGTVFATIADGTINTTSSMTLVGKNYAGYGQFLDTNIIRSLENASNSTAPSAPLTGQLWWKNTPNAGTLSVYMGSAWKTLSAMAVSNATPSSATYSTTGDMWYDTLNQQLNIWTGNTWLLIGPQFTTGTGVTGAFANVVVDTGNVSHKVVELVVNSTVVGLGGPAEITRSQQELSETVFGVISTRAAYLMNSGAGDDATHPPVAMTGRVPVQCTGMVRKGDRLVSAGDGVARAAKTGEATAFNTIGRALVDKLDSGPGIVEAIVTIK